MNTYRTIGLVAYLRKVDASLLVHVTDGLLSTQALLKMRGYAEALATRDLTTTAVVADWPEFFELALAFVVAYGSFSLRWMCERCQLFPALRRGLSPAITPWDRRFLLTFVQEIGDHLEVRAGDPAMRGRAPRTGL